MTDNLACVEIVELVTDYLDGALPAPLAARVDAHLPGCPGCRAVLAQWGAVIALAGQLSPADVRAADPLVRQRILAALRRTRHR